MSPAQSSGWRSSPWPLRGLPWRCWLRAVGRSCSAKAGWGAARGPTRCSRYAPSCRVRGVHNLPTGREHNLADSSVEFVAGDIRDPEVLSAAMQGVRWVFHQAAMVSVPASMADPLGCYEVNLQGTLRVLWAAYQAGVQRVVVASSAAVYGEASAPGGGECPQRP